MPQLVHSPILCETLPKLPSVTKPVPGNLTGLKLAKSSVRRVQRHVVWTGVKYCDLNWEIKTGGPTLARRRTDRTNARSTLSHWLITSVIHAADTEPTWRPGTRSIKHVSLFLQPNAGHGFSWPCTGCLGDHVASGKRLHRDGGCASSLVTYSW